MSSSFPQFSTIPMEDFCCLELPVGGLPQVTDEEVPDFALEFSVELNVNRLFSESETRLIQNQMYES